MIINRDVVPVTVLIVAAVNSNELKTFLNETTESFRHYLNINAVPPPTLSSLKLCSMEYPYDFIVEVVGLLVSWSQDSQIPAISTSLSLMAVITLSTLLTIERGFRSAKFNDFSLVSICPTGTFGKKGYFCGH